MCPICQKGIVYWRSNSSLINRFRKYSIVSQTAHETAYISVALRSGGTCVQTCASDSGLALSLTQSRRAIGARHSINTRSRPLFTPINTRPSTCISSKKITDICPHKRATTSADDECSLPLESTLLTPPKWQLKSSLVADRFF